MDNLFRRNPITRITEDDERALTEAEWLVANGLGGYASGTAGGLPTRVFHGYLIAALPIPFGRTMMLNAVLEELILSDGQHFPLNGVRTEQGQHGGNGQYLADFYLEQSLPVWRFEAHGIGIEKRVFLSHCQNTVYMNYRMTEGLCALGLRLRPAVNMREHEAPVNSPIDTYTFSVRDGHYELQASRGLPPLRMKVVGEELQFAIDEIRIRDVVYEIERSRGYIWRGDLWSPGFFTAEISPKNQVTLIASTEDWEILSALDSTQAWDAEHDRRRRLQFDSDPEAGDRTCRELVLAADQFLFTPVGRREDAARAKAAGDEIRSIIAGYHWFTDWGRDTMISLEGLTLSTGRTIDANYILRTFAHYIKDGLIPNLFPEGKSDGLYHTADATLWFFHALHRYLQRTKDRRLLNHLLPKLLDIVGHHLRGTKFNIHVDHEDGLLVQGQEGYQLTWMDAKVDDWVVTPRRGKAVEINALWYNALCLLQGWLKEAGRDNEARGLAEHASKAKISFNQRFWNEKNQSLHDVVDGENPSADAYCRPNQIFSISLDHPVLEPSRWESVVKTARERLLTPVGLRSLAPGEKEYKPKYDGDLRSRDAAYHQGTVWAWLIGPFIDAWLRTYPGDFDTARHFLEAFRTPARSSCAGTISEIFDAEPPFSPRGCCAQAWSVAEVLRSFMKSSGTSCGDSRDPSRVVDEVRN